MYKAAGMENVDIKLYKDDRHEILNETDCDVVYDDIAEWIGRYIF
jgi:alpha-beta hydrolase superfamily lysophospholipase